jgi:uncharacterized protein YaiE (UPF0345 family)
LESIYPIIYFNRSGKRIIIMKLNFLESSITKMKIITQDGKSRIYVASLLGVVLVVILAVVFLNLTRPAKPPVVETPTEPDLTAALKETTGSVTMQQPGQENFSAANVGDILQLHGQLQTSSSSTARLDLPSGTIIRVAPSSMFTLEVNKPTSSGLTTTLNLTLGQIFIILKSGSLDVTVPGGVASVRGSFMSALIYSTSSKVFVECLEGHCSVNNNAGNVDLTNGQKGVLVYTGNGADQLPQLTVMNQNDYASWLAISPESTDIINQNGNGQNGGKSGPNCQPTHDNPCK